MARTVIIVVVFLPLRLIQYPRPGLYGAPAFFGSVRD